MQPMKPNRVQWSSRRRPVLIALGFSAVLGLAAVVASTLGGGGATGSGALSAEETQQRARAFTGSIALPLVAAADRDAAIDTMALPTEAQASLRADLEAGRSRLAWLSLWDDQAEDGDRVRIAAGGFSLDLDLYKAPHRIGIPVTGEGADLTLTGLRDGGGGITLGVQSTEGVVLTPVIAPGQVLFMRLR